MSKAQDVSSQEMDRQFFLKMAQRSQDLQKQIEQNSSSLKEIVQAATFKKQFENEKRQLEDSCEMAAMKHERQEMKNNTGQSLWKKDGLSTQKSSGESKSSDDISTIELDMDQNSTASVKSQKQDTAADKRRKHKTLILKPIQETLEQESISSFAYKCVFQRCHDDLKFMKIGEKSEGNFLKSPEVLREVIYQIQNI